MIVSGVAAGESAMETANKVAEDTISYLLEHVVSSKDSASGIIFALKQERDRLRDES